MQVSKSTCTKRYRAKNPMPISPRILKGGGCKFFVINHDFFLFLDITLVNKYYLCTPNELKSQTMVNTISITT